MKLSNEPSRQHFQVTSKDDNTRLLAFLRKALPVFPSVKAVKRVIEERGCEINGRVETFSTHPLRSGDTVFFDSSKFAKPPVQMRIPILYEDEYFLFCDKPVGMICEDKECKKYLPKEYSHCILVHRLDRDTSGVLLFAKNKMFKEKMIELFSEQSVRKEYVAIVDGKVRSSSGVIQSFLCKKETTWGQAQMFSQKGQNGKLAITHWKRSKVGEESSLLFCFPKTGRTHQIRVHLSEMGHPILGDELYGKNAKCKERFFRHLLHAAALEFVHPFTKISLRVEAKQPEDFLRAKKILGLL